MRCIQPITLASLLIATVAWPLAAYGQAPQGGAATQRRDRNYPPQLEPARAEVYKTVNDVQLKLYIFEPPKRTPTAPPPAIVFFFGGGFVAGSPAQFSKHCEYLASRGMVAITADYRVRGRHGTTPADSVQDGKDAIRYVRTNAERLGLDPNRIVASGGSAGGLIAACVGVIDSLDQPGEVSAVSYTPNAMVLFNPAIMGRTAIPRTNADGRPSFTTDIMPYHHIREGLPPSIMFFGTEDRLLQGAREFREMATKKDNRCELQTWDGVGHGFFNLGRNGSKEFVATLTAADQFLASLGYVQGDPTVEAFMGISPSGPSEADDGESPDRTTSTGRSAADQPPARRAPRLRAAAQLLDQFDANDDDVLEMAELPSPLKRRLSALDTDEDGKLSQAELTKMRGRPGGRAGEIITGAARDERYDDTLKVGDRAPDFTLADPTGKHEVTLSSFQGKKPVVLIFASYT